MRTSFLTDGAVSSASRATRVADAEKALIQTPTRMPMRVVDEIPLAERIEGAVRATGYWALRGITVTIDAGVVILTGQVPSYYLKQVAQAAALAVVGVHPVRNEIAVASPG